MFLSHILKETNIKILCQNVVSGDKVNVLTSNVKLPLLTSLIRTF
jgi:hypothetical protein